MPTPGAGATITREYLDTRMVDITRRMEAVMLECMDVCDFFARNTDADLKQIRSTANPPEKYTQADVDIIRSAMTHMTATSDAYNGPGKSFVDIIRGLGL